MSARATPSRRRRRFKFSTETIMGHAALFLALSLVSASSALQLRRPPTDFAAAAATATPHATKRHYRHTADQDDATAAKYNAEHTRSLFGRALRKAYRFRNVDEATSPVVTIDPRKVQKKKSEKVPVTDVRELRAAVLDRGRPFKCLPFAPEYDASKEISDVLNHDVLRVLKRRFESGSVPGDRDDDDVVALAMEGGGMRGCVSAGMAAAIACLGLSDAFDKIYGSSAGSVIGSYFVSRQMCLDVYVDILPAARKKFCCKKRIVGTLAVSAMDMLYSNLRSTKREKKRRANDQLASVVELSGGALKQQERRTEYFSSKFDVKPGMNISFVLDGIMGSDHGIRPLDMELFHQNNRLQPLRVASSCVLPDGTLASRCFGAEEFATIKGENGDRDGLFACLQASMTVPGAAGPPVRLSKGSSEEPIPYFDAFCFEPLPYRSAVHEGATHVLVLCSRPDGFLPKHKPGVYEQGVAPLYFRSHDLPQAASFFERGGQQYIYAEDLLTLEDGKKGGKIPVPPPDILYGIDRDDGFAAKADRDAWNTAHLLPLKVPEGTPELNTLEQDKDAVLAAVRSGFAAAFDLLVPAIGLEDVEFTGEEAAKLVFPSSEEDDRDGILRETIRVRGERIAGPPQRASDRGDGGSADTPACRLLARLPGFRQGRLSHLARGLREGGASA